MVPLRAKTAQLLQHHEMRGEDFAERGGMLCGERADIRQHRVGNVDAAVLRRHGNAEQAGARQKIEAGFRRFRRVGRGIAENAGDRAGDSQRLVLRADDGSGARRSVER